ncbi:SDR family oxidoreductase [uncultured Limosilactobacillus sp.]|uniref:SDR family oxidoreductase n=1 Tax=uncultured Limosilactobacillus sp. TaxID=2837629 RepID=UPI0025F179DF|nr:SDR family oxidoreductase [uncultured Limosilactobacillus sp.]
MIKNKVVIITGASSGIGAATTRRLAKHHAKLVLAARRVDRLQKLQAEFPDEEIMIKKADVTSKEDMQALIDAAVEQFGRVDVLYNNAGVMAVNALANRAYDEWQQILDVNIMGVLNGIAAVLPVMIKQKSGQIIATDSVAGHVVVPNLAVYNGSKFAVRAIFEGLRQEQHKNGIRTMIVSPGSVATELYTSINNPENRQAEIDFEKEVGLHADDVARSVEFAIDMPDNADVNEVIIRPIKQDI